MSDSSRIIIVDDHPIVRFGIRALLESELDFEICAEAESAGQAITAMEDTNPDLMVIDISIKGTDGLELTKAIRALNETIPILIVSMHEESIYAERALRAGANGYIMKEHMAEKIVEGMRRILKGDIFVSEEIKYRVLFSLRGAKGVVSKAPIDCLSDRELEVFRNIGEGIGTRNIAEKLHLSIKTIETYRSHIKEKLNLDTAPELVRYAVQWVENNS